MTIVILHWSKQCKHVNDETINLMSLQVLLLPGNAASLKGLSAFVKPTTSTISSLLTLSSPICKIEHCLQGRKSILLIGQEIKRVLSLR